MYDCVLEEVEGKPCWLLEIIKMDYNLWVSSFYMWLMPKLDKRADVVLILLPTSSTSSTTLQFNQVMELKEGSVHWSSSNNAELLLCYLLLVVLWFFKLYSTSGNKTGCCL